MNVMNVIMNECNDESIEYKALKELHSFSYQKKAYTGQADFD